MATHARIPAVLHSCAGSRLQGITHHAGQPKRMALAAACKKGVLMGSVNEVQAELGAAAAPAAQGASRAVAVVQPLGWLHQWQWLKAGARDVRRAWGIALFYGSCFWAMSACLAWVLRAQPTWVMTAASGCILLGPFLAMGLYDASRQLALGEVPQFARSLTAWDRNVRGMGMLLLLLIVLELLWGRASLVVFAVFFSTDMPSTAGVLAAIFRRENWEFVAVYAAVGGTFALLAFALTAISLPMMLDQGSDALTAAITSVQVVAGNTAVMLLWAGVIAGLVAASLYVLWGAPLLLVGPLLGCASWHAYRSAVVWVPDVGADTGN